MGESLNIEKFGEFFFPERLLGDGGGNVFYAGMSAIDIALWDIKGKYLEWPVYQLLGGKTNEKWEPMLVSYVNLVGG